MKIDGIAWDNYVDWQPEHAEVVLDGRFKIEEIAKIHAAVNGANLAAAQQEIARLRRALETIELELLGITDHTQEAVTAAREALKP